MATRQTASLARLMRAPAIILLLIWMIVPLGMTLYYSFLNYNLLNPASVSWQGGSTISISTPIRPSSTRSGTRWPWCWACWRSPSSRHRDRPADRQADLRAGIVRILIISPFFVMPPVAALIWKNMIMHPSYGVFADIARAIGVQPVDWFAQYPLTSIIIIVAWQWLPFATLILLTALQSLDGEQMEAAEMDGAGAVSRFIHLTLPHMARAITVVVLIQTIFLLGIYAEILVTTNGGPGNASTNLTYLIYRAARLNFDIGGAAAGGIIAVILANIVAFFLMRAVGKNLD